MKRLNNVLASLIILSAVIGIFQAIHWLAHGEWADYGRLTFYIVLIALYRDILRTPT